MARGTKPPARKRRKKTEFSKKLVAWAMILTTTCIAISYALAWTDHDSCQEITIAVVTTCIAIATAYEAKSYGEKNSRNKYGYDTNGRRTGAERRYDDDSAAG